MPKVLGFAEEEYKKITCKNCAAINQYTQNEVKEINGIDYSGGSDGCTYIECGNCNKRIIIKSW